MPFIKTGAPHPIKSVREGSQETIVQLCEICNTNKAEFNEGTKRVCNSNKIRQIRNSEGHRSGVKI